MSAAALGLALGAAVLHAVWNLMLRGARDTEAVAAVSVVAFVLVLAPIAVFTWDVEGAAWKYVVASGAFELAYIAFLAAAYRRFEASLVYPVARGLAPVAALLITIVVLGATPSAAEIGGVFAVAVGVLLVRGASSSRGVLLAIVIAATIGAYTVIDRYGIQHADAVSYAMLIMLGPAIAYPQLVGVRRVRAAVSGRAVAIGVLSATAYLLVLLALRRASAPSVSAVRETGVVIATVLAAAFLHERVTRARLGGAVLVACGVALLALS